MDNNLSNKLDSNNDIYSPQKQETVDNANSTTTYTQNINTPQGDSYALYSKSENIINLLLLIQILILKEMIIK